MLCGLDYLLTSGLVHEEITSASVLVTFGGDVKISDIERCRQGGDIARLWDSFSRVVMSLMDKTKSQTAAIGLTRPDQWSADAIDLFTMAVSQPAAKLLIDHAFMQVRDQDALVWLVPFVLISALHIRE